MIVLPAAGIWMLRLNGDWQGYTEDLAGHASGNLVTEPDEHDGFHFQVAISSGPHGVRIVSK